MTTPDSQPSPDMESRYQDRDPRHEDPDNHDDIKRDGRESDGREQADPKAGDAGPADALSAQAGPATQAEPAEAGPAAEADDTHGAAAPGLDEQALRRLMHDAVGGLQPASDALNRLRTAVPARKAHRRQVMVGAAAACLLAIAAVPAALRVADTVNSAQTNPANASSTHDSGVGESRGAVGGKGEGSRPVGTAAPGGKHSGGTRNHQVSPSATLTPGVTSPADPGGTLVATVPACAYADLGNAGGSAGTADSSGRITGSFKVANVSSSACTVIGQGTITATAQGSADSSRITVVDHTAGDGTGLPDTASQTLVLKPGDAYQVEFVWVPAAGGDTSGCTATAQPSPSDSPTGSTGIGGTTDGSTSSSSGSGGSTAASTSSDSASVLLTNTPAAGGPVYSTVLSGACAGTVYRTGLLPSQ